MLRYFGLSAILVAQLALSSPLFGTEKLDAVDLSGNSIDPFSSKANVQVLLFARSDCPITKRYAPEIQRLSGKFASKGVAFWLVFEDASETPGDIHTLIDQYKYPGTPLRDPSHILARRAHATVAPEAAVFDREGRLVYHGRIDDRYVDIGKSKPVAQVHDLENAISAVLSGTPVKESETRAVGCSLADVE
ncbi:MAG: redoxin domain-containing protein [Acidobacteriota bacterium]|nr:redoxin domain-containing protein [Acidobacteriota bacterium]